MSDPAVTMTRWLNGATMGHADHGKSTLIGFFLCDIGEVAERHLNEAAAQAALLKRPDLKYAFLMDRIAEERKRGMSMQSQYVGFCLDGGHMMLIDNPGHPSFIRHLITGTSQADFGILVIAANQFEDALATPSVLSGNACRK